MIKKLISLAVASASTLVLAGCGETSTPTVDKSVMGDGTTNQTGLGGYWWTYVDRGDTSLVDPNTGKKEPRNAAAKELLAGLSNGNGIAADETGNLAFHITGKVGPAPAYPPPEDIYDDYWDASYSDICVDGKCSEYRYPSAGLGFGFKAKNVPLGADAAGTKGLGFRMKLGSTHAKAADNTTPRPVTVSVPMDYTDVPDPSFEDEFGTKYLPAGANDILYPGQAADANLPLCSFPGTKIPGTEDVVGSQAKTCFCNMTTGAGKNKPLPLTETWQTFCVTWEDFGAPDWGGLSSVSYPEGGIMAVDPAHVIKMQFDAYKPVTTDGAEYSAIFDFWVDDVALLDQAKWDTYCAGAKMIEAN